MQSAVHPLHFNKQLPKYMVVFLASADCFILRKALVMSLIDALLKSQMSEIQPRHEGITLWDDYYPEKAVENDHHMIVLNYAHKFPQRLRKRAVPCTTMYSQNTKHWKITVFTQNSKTSTINKMCVIQPLVSSEIFPHSFPFGCGPLWVKCNQFKNDENQPYNIIYNLFRSLIMTLQYILTLHILHYRKHLFVFYNWGWL